MYNNFIKCHITVIVSSRGDNLLEYKGTLIEEDAETILLQNVDISYLMLSFQKGLFGDGITKYKDNVESVRINKRYIISCDK